MMKMRLLFLQVLLLLPFMSAWGQIQVAGYVRDSLTREPLSRVTIAVLYSDEGTMSNQHGGFSLKSDAAGMMVRLSAVGYRTKDVLVHAAQSVLVVDMVPSSVELGEVVVKRTKERYSKKDNPAVKLARELIARRDRGNPMRSGAYYSYDKYERIMYGLNDFDSTSEQSFAFKKLSFLVNYADSSHATGKRVLPLSIKEKFAHEYYRNAPRAHREVIVGQKNSGIDDQADDQASVKRFLDDWFREVDIFQNDVTMLTNRFVSPLSRIATEFYKFYLTDTLRVDGEQCYELSFVPFTPESFGFLGRLYVRADSSLFIKKVTMNVPHKINLNYVERVFLEQEFVQTPDGVRHKVRDDMEIEFLVMPGTPGLYARRECAYTAHTSISPEDLSIFDNKEEQIVLPGAEYMPDEFWADNRPRLMRTDATTMRQMLARLRQSRLFYWGEKVLVALVKGYVPTSSVSKWDIGPINTMISGNSLEGVRLRLGGMSTVNLSGHWFMRGYAAYVTRDEKLKYNAQLEYSFREKKQLDQEFPIHSVRVKHEYDVDKLGQQYLYTNADNAFLVIKRQKDDKMIYRRLTELKCNYEMHNHMSVSVALQHVVREASRLMPFVDGDGLSHSLYREAGIELMWRFAPGETFYQTRSYRIPINMDAPIITLKHTYMPKGMLGSRYEVNKTELGLQKRFWFSAFGYCDVILKGAKMLSGAAFPDLLLPNANLSYTVQPESYALMSALEFVNDQYVSCDVTYWANGAILNRMPLIKYLKLREVFTFRGLWGDLSDKNNPLKNTSLLRFPDNALCGRMSRTPYMEMGVGLDNIFTFLRVDYVWRLSYRHTLGTDRRGVRLQLHFTF